MKTNTIMNGSALEHLKELPDQSIDMVMTSPPYWALRDYGVHGQLGLEPSFEEYVNKLCDIFDGVKRVLKKHGTCWVNLGDTYAGTMPRQPKDVIGSLEEGRAYLGGTKDKGITDKCLIMIPMRFAIEMVNRGWILRNVIIWHKPNCMPSSIKDRFTVDFEYLFFFSKNKKYYFETQYEPNETKGDSRIDKGNLRYDNETQTEVTINSIGRNKRTVWKINPKPFSEAHFAVYPEEICETPIKAGCPRYVCKKCGNAKERRYEYESNEKLKEVSLHTKYENLGQERKVRQGFDSSRKYIQPRINDRGLQRTCNCNEGFTSGIVLDPFFGAGTTGVVALKQGKKFIGIELNKEYIKIAEKRLKPYLEQEKLVI